MRWRMSERVLDSNWTIRPDKIDTCNLHSRRAANRRECGKHDLTFFARTHDSNTRIQVSAFTNDRLFDSLSTWRRMLDFEPAHSPIISAKTFRYVGHLSLRQRRTLTLEEEVKHINTPCELVCTQTRKKDFDRWRTNAVLCRTMCQSVVFGTPHAAVVQQSVVAIAIAINQALK